MSLMMAQALVRSSARIVLPLVSVVVIVAAAGAVQSPPAYKNGLVNSMPVLNGIPSKDDPPSVVDNDRPASDSCSCSSGTVSELADDTLYQDTGDPVGLHNGMVSYRVTDLFIPGRKLHLEFTRRYNSKAEPVAGQAGPVDGPLGYGWDHNFNLLIQANDTQTSAILFNGNTRLDQYSLGHVPAAGEALDSPAGIYNRLFWGPPPGGSTNTFWTRGRYGSKTVFEFSRVVTTSPVVIREYRVKSIQDSNGNTQTFEYNSTTGRLAKVWDSLGRAIEFLYDDTANPQHITRVKDYTGREIQYSYSNGNLVSVRTPVTTPVTENGVVFNDFSAGRIERYTYSSGTGDPVLDHNLLTVQRPAEDGTNPPEPALSFTYYQSNSSSGFKDWCATQVMGGGTGLNAAGGTITYTYSTSSIPSGAAVRTTVRDRRGNETDYTFDITGHATQIDERQGTTSTVLASTTFQYNADGQVTHIQRPLGNVEDRTYFDGQGLPTAVQRYLLGNLSTITRTVDGVRGTGGTSSGTVGVSFEWEPVFNHLRKRTDELGRVTEFVCDYMEGNATLTAPLIEQEMGINSADAATIAGATGLLRNADLNGDNFQNQIHGNVVAIIRPATTLSSVGGSSIGQIAHEPNATQESIETYVYNQYGQMIARTDAEENSSVFLYYPETKPFDGTTTSGGGTNTVTGGYLRRVDRDVALPYTADAQLSGVGARNVAGDFGRDTNQNPAAVSAKTDLVYDSVGNLAAVVDPRGVRTDFLVNALNEVWKVTRASSVADVTGRAGGAGGSTENLSGQAFAYEQKRLYDADGRLKKTFVQNTGNNSDAGQVSGFLETQYVYDILGDVKQVVNEVGGNGTTATWQYTYDPNQNLVTVTAPEQNTTTYEFDERDQLTKVTRGSGSEKTIVSFVYDANGNRTVVKDGLNHATQLIHDGFDRVWLVDDPLGNRKEFTRDAASLVHMVEEKGWKDGTSGAGFSLRKTFFDYDEQQRLIRTDIQDPQNALVDGALTPNDTNKVSRRIDYDRLGRVTFQIEDDLAAYETRYDGLSRVVKTIEPDVGNDGTANTVDAQYDDNGNLVKVIETEEYPTGSTNPTRTFETFDIFDALDRRTSSTDNLGNTVRFGYDSRDNLVLSTDAKGPNTGLTINGRSANDAGNATRYFHDGLDRLLTTEMDLNVGGVSSGGLDLTNPYNLDGKVTLVQKWDLNGRLVEQTDDRRKTTKYVYDAADRLKEQWFADYTGGPSISYAHNDAGNVTQVTDRRGNVSTMGYDVLNRRTSVHAALAGGTVGSTDQTFEYDGLGRCTKDVDSVDATLGNGDDAIVVRTFDALSRIKTDVQNGRTVTSTWKEEGKRTSLGYSSTANPLTVTYAHDILDRLSTISTGVTQLAEYKYAGPERILKRTLTVAPTASVTEKHYTGSFDDTLFWDGARRPTRIDTTTRTGTTRFEHAFDGNYNRLFERRVHDSSQGDNYVYDSLDRLVTFERKVPAGNVGTPGQPGAQTVKSWQLDGVQNWRSTTTNGLATTIAVNAVNAYTSLLTGGVTESPQYDTDGNLTSPNTNATPVVTLRYDFQNRLREITDGTNSVLHDYDASGRRIRTHTIGTVAGCPPWVEYVHDGWEVIEEFDGSNNLMRRFVMGSELDEPLRMDTFSFWLNPGTYYFQRSTLGNIVALSDSTGSVVERYTYDAYGAPQFETAGSVAKAVTYSDYGNPYLFTGRRYEPWIRNLYEFRHRFMDPALGRFVQRDPPGVWSDRRNLGNPLGYVGANTPNLADPLGLDGGVTAAGLVLVGGGGESLAASAFAVLSGPVGWVILGTAVIVVSVAIANEANIYDAREHDSNRRRSTRDNHQNKRGRQKEEMQRKLDRLVRNGDKRGADKQAKKMRDLGHIPTYNVGGQIPGSEVVSVFSLPGPSAPSVGGAVGGRESEGRIVYLYGNGAMAVCDEEENELLFLDPYEPLNPPVSAGEGDAAGRPHGGEYVNNHLW